ncbi:serine/threonine-protein kinase 17A-like [Pollicipes pollicipes]|uniref:serine/threonine-protein kinase 17A-like n=1 Tax=Pollicipes pollicipes TaxID=41117 RepID=UPI001884BCE0|nr:serine/threonine-protein kinase 17A-like [Pollicipes pollicipes]
MCDVHPPLTGVSLVGPTPVMPQVPAASDLPPGFMTLSEEEHSAMVRRQPIEKYYEIYPTPISTGQWASVYKCRRLGTELEFAAKFCSKSRLGLDARREIVHEMAAMLRCRRCPRVVQLHELFETEQQYILVMELGSGGDLQGILDNNQVPYEADVVRFMRSLLEGLAFLHERSIAHLDIKPQNLVLTGAFPDCDIKLCDLEISRVISPAQDIREMLGTPDYVCKLALHSQAPLLRCA